MNINFLTATKLAVLLALGLLPLSTLAQTAPTPDTTFTAGGDNLWTNSANWDVRVPLTNDNAWISAGQTSTHNSAGITNIFGTLTLDSSSKLQLSGIPGLWAEGNDIYFGNGSEIEFTSGSWNRNAGNVYALPGGTGTLRGSISMLKGSVVGSGNLNVFIGGNIEWRSSGTSFSGDLSFFSTTTASRKVGLSRFSGVNCLGTGTATISSNVYFASSVNGDTTGKLSPSSTLQVIGVPGTTLPKIDMVTSPQTISNLIVGSPGLRTGTSPLLRTGSTTVSCKLTVTNTVTFQGTANTVEIDDLQTTPSGSSLATSNLTFTGSGNWTVIGDGGISVSGGTITTDVSATISNTLTAANGFIKAGSGTITLGDPSGAATEITVSEGAIIFDTIANFTASDYVTFEVQDASFTADFGGSFTDIAAVQAALGSTGNFRKDAVATGTLKVTDNGDGTFTVMLGPVSGTILIIK